MQTPSEYLKNGIPKSNELWLNGLDIVKHCLQGDSEQSFFKANDPAKKHLTHWQDAMAQRAESDGSFIDIYDNAYKPEVQWQTFDNDTGMLDVGQFINGESLCFEDDIEVYEQGQCVSVIIDMAIPWSEREDTIMQTRHEQVYNLIAQCDGENRPIQVIGAFRISVSEHKKPLNIFIVVKEYNDTIFPAIWGTLIDNRSCNDFINVIMDYFVGTIDGGNGQIKAMDQADQYFPEHEELHIFGKRITSQYNQNKGE